MAAATFLVRALPFFLLGKKQDHPVLNFIGKYLPPAVMVILVFYCLNSVNAKVPPYGIPEAAGVLVVASLQYWKRNTLLSILGGTLIYQMLCHL